MSTASASRRLRRSKLRPAKRRLALEPLESRQLLALVSYWSGDNTAADPISGNNGTLYNGAAYAAGQVGQAFSFDGIDDRISVADSPGFKLTQSLSIEGWIKVNAFPSGATNDHGEILFRGDDRGGLDPYSLSVEPNGQLFFQISSLTASVSLSAPIAIGQSVHVAAVLDDAAGIMKLYENGALVTQRYTDIRPFADLDPASNPGVGIGNHGGFPATPHNFPFNGQIDELKLYSHALTAADVQANFNATKGPSVISVTDATAIEGSSAMKVLDRFVNTNSGGLTRPRTPLFGPDANGDGQQDLYVISTDTNEILRFDGKTGAFVDTFVTAGSGGLVNPGDIAFGSDGKMYVSSIGTPAGTPVVPGAGSVLRYSGTTGAFIDTFATGLTSPLGIAFAEDGSLLTAEQNTDQVVRTSGGVTSAFISPGSGGLDNPRNVLIGPDVNGDSHPDLYVSSQSYDAVLRYDGQTGAFIDKFASTGLATGPQWIEFAPDGSLVAEASTSGCCNVVYVRFDGMSGAKIDQVPTPTVGWSFRYGPDGLIYASGNQYNNVDRIGASSLVAFTVNLTYASDVPVTVNYSTASGSATSGVDFAPVSGTITFAPGQTTRGILIPTLDDGVYEGNETFTINLSAPVGATIADSQGVATITDNELPPTKFYVVDDGSANKTYEYGASGVAVENYSIGNTAPRGAASTAAGDKVWVVDANKNVYVYGTSGNLLGSWAAGSLPSNASVQGITTNGADVWLVDDKGNKVYRYAGAASRLSGSQNAASSFSLNSSNSSPSDLVTDGASIWVVNNASGWFSTDKVFKYTVSGTLQGSWTISGGGGSPTGITIDPSSVSDIWIVDSSSDRIYQFNGAASRTSGSQFPSTSFALAAGNTNPQGLADPPTEGGSAAYDSALLAIVGELDDVLGTGKKRR